MKKYLYMAIASLFIFSAGELYAQKQLSNGIEFDKVIHDFGTIMMEDGPVTCTYNLTNKGSKAVVIFNVATTCGCTDVTWTQEPIKPGKTGIITVTYSNDEGPNPFDKSVTVYTSDEKKPTVLKLRGISKEIPRPLAEVYPVHYGPLGIKESSINCGNISQGSAKTDFIKVANLSNKPIKLKFRDISDNLELSLSPNPIPADSTADLTYRITTDRETWGNNRYRATPVINGKKYKNSEGKEKIEIHAFTQEDFSRLTPEQTERGPMPDFEFSSYYFRTAKLGSMIHATFTFTNEGKKPFCIYKLETDACCYSHSTIPVAMPGETVSFRVHINTRDMEKGEHLTRVTLTTNSPLRPTITLFIAGILE